MPNAIEKAMLVLRMLSDAGGAPVTLAAMAERLEINKSTLAHIVKTLAEGGYVQRISHSEGYTLGPELYYLARQRYGEDLIAVCRPLLRWLYRETGGTAVLAVLRSTRKYIIDNIDGVGYYKSRGAGASILSDDIYRTVTGRVLLAAMPEHAALEIYGGLGAPKPGEWEGVTDRDSFFAALREVRAQGCYILPKDDAAHRRIALAVPLTDGGVCVGALGLVVVYEDAADVTEAEAARLSRKMERCRREAERRLKFG